MDSDYIYLYFDQTIITLSFTGIGNLNNNSDYAGRQAGLPIQ